MNQEWKGSICSAGEDCVDVTVKGVVNDEIEFMFVNSMYESIFRLDNNDPMQTTAGG